MASVVSKKIFQRLKKGMEIRGVAVDYQPGQSRQSRRPRERQPAQTDSQPEMGFQIPQGMAVPMTFPMDIRRPEIDLEHIEDLRIPSETGILGTKKPKETEDKTAIKITYPLIPRNPKPNETVFAYSVIRYEPAIRSLMYHLLEPKLTDEEKKVIKDIQKDLEERLNVDISKMGYVETKNVLMDEVDRSLATLGFRIDPGRKEILLYYIERDTLGFGPIDALMKDPNIEDLSCDGVNVPLYAYYRDPRIGSVRTNVFFSEGEELDSFITKLAQKTNKTISIAEPLLDGTLTDGSRIQATLGSDISRKGSNFTIRKFSENPLTPTHMLNYKTVNSLQLAYLWMAIDNGKSILVSGGTATGKTSMLNVLSLFIRPAAKIVSIEDTAEIRLPHEHWVPQVARTAMSVRGATGEVTLFDLLKASLRQRPDYIILGEVRGKEAFVLFQQMASIPGDEKVIVYNDGHTKAVPIAELDGKTYKLPTMDPDTGKMKVSEMKTLVEHTPVSELFKITTATGRQVMVTGNHSVFTSRDGKIEASLVGEMKIGDSILVPVKLPSGFKDVESLDLTELLSGIRVYSPRHVKMAQKKLGFEKASKVAGFTTISNYYGSNNCALPAANFRKLMKEAGISYKPEEIEVRFERGKSPKTSAKLDITPELLRLMGYYVSEGSINIASKNNSVALYNRDPAVLDDMRKCITKVAGSKITERETEGFGTCTELRFNHKTIFELFKQCCGGSKNRKVPDFVMGLSQEKIGQFLSGLYAGDSSMNGDRFCYYTVSRQLAQGVCNLLLSLSIFPHIRERRRKGRKTTDYEVVFYREEEMRKFLKVSNPVGKHPVIMKQEKAKRNTIGDLYADKIKHMEKICLDRPEPVYDISVPGTQNFVGGFGGIMLHNTGHPSLATIHAASVPQLIDRLTTKPIDLPARLLENIDVVVFIKLSRLNDRIIRRAVVIAEVVG
ncbi:MAG: ATPase, T2SS/T4P/T4SS family, partial [Candidatus Aenigmatarchaeota archaeon]